MWWSPERRGAAIIDDPDKREKLILRTDENLDPVAVFGPVQQIDDVGLGLQVREEGSDPFQILCRPNVPKQIGLAANDELVARLRRAGP